MWIIYVEMAFKKWITFKNFKALHVILFFSYSLFSVTSSLADSYWKFNYFIFISEKEGEVRMQY